MKKIGFIALIGCLSLSLTGCEASNEDLNKQIAKMANIIEEGDLFDEDYQIKGEMISFEDGVSTSIKYHIEVDDDNMWSKITTTEDGKEKVFQTWVGEKDDTYYAFYDSDGKKTYTTFNDDDEIEDAFDASVSLVSGLSSNLEELYKSVKETLEGSLKSCDSKITGTSCSVERNIFGTVKFNVTQGIVSGMKAEMSYSLRGGKIKKMSSKLTYGEENVEVTMKYSYLNQIVRLPKVSEFEKID